MLKSHFDLSEQTDQNYDIGCYMTCLFAKITEDGNGEICVTVEGEPIPIRRIIYQFVGSKDKLWLGKPKIFIVVQQEPSAVDDFGKVKIVGK